LNRVAWRQVLLGLIVLIGLLLPASRLHAETDGERLERAKALFREGNALLSAGDAERALERFLQSRAAVASGKNTANAAICLERLGRYDEALEMYEELLARFAKDLDEQDRENLAPIMGSLRARLGSIDISSNVEGLIVVDGKPRGRLPRTTALRVLAGKHLIRVVQEGYRSFELTVEVASGAVVAVDASLEPLSGLGALRVEQTGHLAANLLIDGKAVGVLPWEGTLPTNRHLLQVLGSDDGSKPQAVRVLERKMLLIRLTTQKLGPVVRLEAVPRSALLTLDGTELGSGFWTGRLPVGAHVVSAAERGYFDKQLAFTLTPETPPPALQVPLERDPNSSRWPQPARWYLGARLLTGGVYAPTLNGDAERACPTLCAGSASAAGAKVEGALELLHQRGLGVEAAFGYQFVSQNFTRAVTSHFDHTQITYALRQKLAMGGVYGRLAGVAELPLRWAFSLRSSVGGGVASMAYVASADGVAWTTGELAPVAAFGYQRVSEVMPFGTSALDLQRAFGKLAISLGVAGWFVPSRGPRFSDEVQLQITTGCDPPTPTAVRCAPRSNVLAGERAHGAFAALTAELGARYRF
jgi:PEGA domain